MVNFIVCEDNQVVLQKNIEIINNVMFKNNINYRIYRFTNNTSKLQELIKDDIGDKIYLLDIELDSSSGIDIARQIRKNDSKSIIIISTTYIEYLPYSIKNELMLFSFISKFENYEDNLMKVIKKAVDKIDLRD